MAVRPRAVPGTDVNGPTVAPASGRRGFTDHAPFGMAIFVLTEIMLFMGFLSAFSIVRNSVPPGMWPPADQPRLPFERTAFNTLMLLASGIAVFWAHRAHGRAGAAAARVPLVLGCVLGALFVGLQGAEWAALLAQGLTVSSSQIGGFFYLIVGCHAAHAIAALLYLLVCLRGLLTGTLTRGRFSAALVFWGFVVLMWPALWWMVYR